MNIRTLSLYAVAKLLPPNILVSNHAICPSISHAPAVKLSSGRAGERLLMAFAAYYP